MQRSLFSYNSYNNKQPAEIQCRSSSLKSQNIQESYFSDLRACPKGAGFIEELLQEQSSWQAPPLSPDPSINTWPPVGTREVPTFMTSLAYTKPRLLCFGRLALPSPVCLRSSAAHPLPRKLGQTLPTPCLLTHVFCGALVPGVVVVVAEAGHAEA